MPMKMIRHYAMLLLLYHYLLMPMHAMRFDIAKERAMMMALLRYDDADAFVYGADAFAAPIYAPALLLIAFAAAS